MVAINFSWTQVGFSDEVNELVTKLDDRSHTYPLVYALSLLGDGIVEYQRGFSRTLYIGRSERSSGRGRMRAHLNWMRKALLLNPALTGFRVAYSAEGDIPLGRSQEIEGHCLRKFKNNLGDVPLFNTNSARKFDEDVEFHNERGIFRCSANSRGAAIVIQAKGRD